MLQSNRGCVCVCVCLCVCLNVCFSTTKTDETILIKLSTKDLRDNPSRTFIEFWIFKIDDIITVIFCSFKPAHSRSQFCQSLKVRLIIWILLYLIYRSIVKGQIDSFYYNFCFISYFPITIVCLSFNKKQWCCKMERKKIGGQYISPRYNCRKGPTCAIVCVLWLPFLVSI